MNKFNVSAHSLSRLRLWHAGACHCRLYCPFRLKAPTTLKLCQRERDPEHEKTPRQVCRSGL